MIQHSESCLSVDHASFNSTVCTFGPPMTWILGYLEGMKMLNLQIGGVRVLSGDVKIESWSEADFAADKSDRKSVSGYVVMGDGAVVFCFVVVQETDSDVTEPNGSQILCGFTGWS
uniref:AlNc14C457G11766 protein n=1 Tax=Albugo laibachii Nc14 TaxID=890382 RepID=F0X027_9STRA|nr:AlNc14C457G11766 [Albugo laibachii Nc14]|eukprot:CCA27109.1 AlNc14C457G11766 [Albugo laibachii Nc14]